MSDSTIEAYRNAANLKSIIRSDPNVLEILETSVYSTIYHWLSKEDGDGEWAKQKLEGPTFIIKRNGQPEHAIFMLNRLNTKNTTIPLIKGEMKVTKVGEVMLQIARRGEKVKRGIWFSEADVVERFHARILDLCGLPTSKPLDQSLTLDSPSPSSPAPRPSSSQSINQGKNKTEDGFSRLFAGLMTTGESSRSPNFSAPSPQQAISSTTNLESSSSREAIQPDIPTTDTPSHVETSVTITESNLPISPNSHQNGQNEQDSSSLRPMSISTGPPGQTVDDLLNSILGITPTINPSTRPIQNIQTSTSTSFQPQSQQSNFNSLPPPESAPPVPVDSKPISSTNDNHHPLPHIPIPDSHQRSDMPLQQPIQHLMNGQHPSQPHQMDMGPSIGLNKSEMAIQEAMLDALGGVPDLRPRGRDGFKMILEELVQKEPRFVDDIWRGYIRRMG